MINNTNLSQTQSHVEFVDLRPDSGTLMASISVVKTVAECNHWYSNFPYDGARCCSEIEFHAYGYENYDQKQRTGRLPISLHNLILSNEPKSPSTDFGWKITKQVLTTVSEISFIIQYFIIMKLKIYDNDKIFGLMDTSDNFEQSVIFNF